MSRLIATENDGISREGLAPPVHQPKAKLTAYYLSKDRVLSLIGAGRFPAPLLAEMQRKDGSNPSAILSNELGSYLFEAIASGGIKSLQQLAYEQALKNGTPFIYEGNVRGQGFSQRNKTQVLSLTINLDEPLSGKTLS